MGKTDKKLVITTVISLVLSVASFFIFALVGAYMFPVQDPTPEMLLDQGEYARIYGPSWYISICGFMIFGLVSLISFCTILFRLISNSLQKKM